MNGAWKTRKLTTKLDGKSELLSSRNSRSILNFKVAFYRWRPDLTNVNTCAVYSHWGEWPSVGVRDFKNVCCLSSLVSALHRLEKSWKSEYRFMLSILTTLNPSTKLTKNASSRSSTDLASAVPCCLGSKSTSLTASKGSQFWVSA